MAHMELSFVAAVQSSNRGTFFNTTVLGHYLRARKDRRPDKTKNIRMRK
jgi:hypothetical protein